jgi:hypothetical protein
LERISKIREKLRGMTAEEVAGEILIRSKRAINHSLSRATSTIDNAYLSDGDLQRSLLRPIADVAEKVRRGKRPHLTEGLKDARRTAEIIKRLFPESIAQAASAAEEILAHRIKVFARRLDLGPDIDWLADPFTGKRWPQDHFTIIEVACGDGSDARVAWELNRLHHFTSLGRTYLLTGDERYAEEFLRQLASWNAQNPPGFGINWANAMEAAIRAANIIAATEMFRLSPLMTDERVALILKMLVSHGRFIRANLEYSFRAPSNHYLSDLLGLFVIGATMPDIRESRRWLRFSARRLLKELMRQVLPDGVSYEGSTAYHRLVLEIFALMFSMREATKINFPLAHRNRLRAMFRFTKSYIKPDGTAPIVGDSDDGRLIRFTERPATDHTYLLSIGATLLEDDEFKTSDSIDEEAVWWAGERGVERFDALPKSGGAAGSRAFRESQIFIEREGAAYAIIDCGDHGIGGRGSHAHSDALSVEVFAYGQTFLRDPGTFVYTGDPRMRNLFRSTAYHNTVRVDGRDISRIREDRLFALGENVKPKVNRWKSDEDQDLLDAQIDYADLPLTHRRQVVFDKQDLFWVVKDIFTGGGEHLFEFFFNFDSGVELDLQGDSRALATAESARLMLVPQSGASIRAEIVERWVSLAYGERDRSFGIIYRFQTTAPFENTMFVIPFRRGDEAKVERVLTKS